MDAQKRKAHQPVWLLLQLYSGQEHKSSWHNSGRGSGSYTALAEDDDQEDGSVARSPANMHTKQLHRQYELLDDTSGLISLLESTKVSKSVSPFVLYLPLQVQKL
ncbi:Uncharacterized protein M6B38_237730 [Iris pallida]|uniref:Uncharacterized protein n=1 Tax=Iris pallida TaxID=29817 RepID=A0AAX6DH28_IRIPA|nr:Uncharacterized protein M6B38_246115 [Iris pallida]KAJ6792859.1 Uncharacterized protein M6B38_237730 [Iris pallida]